MQSQRSVDPVQSSTTPSRRAFLKASAAVAGATAIGPLVLRGAAPSTVANSKLNLAVVGCGGQGRGDMKGLLANGGGLGGRCGSHRGGVDPAPPRPRQQGARAQT